MKKQAAAAHDIIVALDLGIIRTEQRSTQQHYSNPSVPQPELAMRGSDGLVRGLEMCAGTRRSFLSDNCTWWHLLSSRLDETGGRELKNQYV